MIIGISALPFQHCLATKTTKMRSNIFRAERTQLLIVRRSRWR